MTQSASRGRPSSQSIRVLQKFKLRGQKELESEKILAAGAHSNAPLDTVALVRVAGMGGGLSMPFRELISE